MSKRDDSATPTGPAAAAALSAGIGSFTLGLAVALAESSKAVANLLDWYQPTGPLSGKTGIAIIVWLASWVALGVVWGKKDVRLKPVFAVSIALLAIGLLLTFPPVFDLLAGKS